MANSLRDQLLKGGVTSKKKAKAAEHEARAEAARRRKAGETDGGALAAAKALEEKRARGRELNLERKRARQDKELAAQARDLIVRHRTECGKGSIRHNFAHGKTVKHVDVTEEQHEQLTDGDLAITFLDDRYALVPADVAARILERAPEAIVYLAEPREVPAEDDPYAGYEVPDDLMW